MARIVQSILNQIIVGNVLTVDDQINAKLENNAKIYNHHHCLPSNNPGNTIDIFVINAKNSTVFGLFQYFLCPIVLRALSQSVLNFILNCPKTVYDPYTQMLFVFDNLKNNYTYQVHYYIF